MTEQRSTADLVHSAEGERELRNDGASQASSDRDGMLNRASDRPDSEESTADTAMPSSSGMKGGLLDESALTERRQKWASIQTHFVDEPRQSVQEADALVADVMTELAQAFAHEREGLEQQWGRGGEASTEDLRQALQHYRAFFERLLAA